MGLSALLVEALLASPEEKHGGGLQDGGEIRTPFLSAAGLSSAMEAHSVDVRQCYEAMLNNKPSQLGGRVLLSFVITPAGAVDNPSVDQKRSTLHDLGLAACLLKVLETVTFPNPPDAGSAAVEYPVTFQLPGDRITRPVLISGPNGRTTPVYSEAARAAGVEGTVIVRCTLTVEGEAKNCDFVKSIPKLDELVLEFLSGARFQPVIFRGMPIQVVYVFNYHFRLR
ncbi:MAG: TonB family protein [Myxococcaceae bacterium]